MNNNLTLADYNIQQGNTLNLSSNVDPRTLELCTTLELCIKIQDGKSITIRNKDSDSIKNLKEKIQEKEEIALDQQVLIYHGKILDNTKTLSECKIKTQSIICLFLNSLSLAINDFASTSRVIYQLNFSSRILDLKNTIKGSINTTSNEKILTCKNILLRDNKNIVEYEINHGDEIYLHCQDKVRLIISNPPLSSPDFLEIDKINKSNARIIKEKCRKCESEPY